MWRSHCDRVGLLDAPPPPLLSLTLPKGRLNDDCIDFFFSPRRIKKKKGPILCNIYSQPEVIIRRLIRGYSKMPLDHLKIILSFPAALRTATLTRVSFCCTTAWSWPPSGTDRRRLQPWLASRYLEKKEIPLVIYSKMPKNKPKQNKQQRQSPRSPELTFDLGSLESGLLTKPACIKCSANWLFMFCSIWIVRGDFKHWISLIGQKTSESCSPGACWRTGSYPSSIPFHTWHPVALSAPIPSRSISDKLTQDQFTQQEVGREKRPISAAAPEKRW